MKRQKIPRSSSAAVAQAYDVIVVGGGLAGLAQGCLLARAGFSVLLCEAAALPTLGDKNYDLRTTALSFASRNILQDIGVWDELAPHACPIQDIRIADGNAPGYLHFNAGEVDAEAFGWIVENHRLRSALTQKLQSYKNAELRAPVKVTALAYGAVDVAATLSDGKTQRAKLLIAADGRNSFVREWAGIQTIDHDYQTHAVVCNLWHEKDHHHHAIEHFMPNGPFAVLPMMKGKKHFHSSLVWSETPERAAALVEMDEKDFNALLFHHMPHYGKIGVAGPRRAYPLSFKHAVKYYAPRIALISETVHAMHPIAGQGLNVGMRDVACLSQILMDARTLGLDIGSEVLLQRYGAMRMPDSLAMSAATYGLDALFSNHLATAAWARRRGLGIVGKIMPLKKFFMRYAMGLTHRPTHRIAA
ncbi:MAG TPA: UbiH/UbiF/VisC/COQ6 family ubiquinone biosynthesis hydroxylase [Alphaproteobacteria bacterium]|nr:UbiH/UbiF/VisC/COQ6 family ubiquinone biosynthesis hydroxylase [Alphaproteobacteria bacterium]